MEQPIMAFTAVYIKTQHGYVGFIEELPAVNSHGATIDEARHRLREIAAVVFDAERQNARELLAGRQSVREPFMIPLRPDPLGPPIPDATPTIR